MFQFTDEMKTKVRGDFDQVKAPLFTCEVTVPRDLRRVLQLYTLGISTEERDGVIYHPGTRLLLMHVCGEKPSGQYVYSVDGVQWAAPSAT
jgi:hypothetical protein